MKFLTNELEKYSEELNGTALIILTDDSNFLSQNLNNFLWITFTRSNPSHDVYGVKSFTKFKHWGCESSLIIDARIKPHHAPPLVLDHSIDKKIEPIFNAGGSLYGKL
jgi:4-hydroxy-3-polyprenylbenzoate decarboxylase